MNEDVVISSLMVLASPPTWTTKPSYNSVLQMDIKYLFEYTQKNKVLQNHMTQLLTWEGVGTVTKCIF